MLKMTRQVNFQKGTAVGAVMLATSCCLPQPGWAQSALPATEATALDILAMCPDPDPPTSVVRHSSNQGYLVYCPSHDYEENREYGAVFRRRAGVSDVLLIDGGDFDPFDGTVVYDSGGQQGDEYFNRVICQQVEYNSDPYTATRTQIQSGRIRSSQPLPADVAEKIRNLDTPRSPIASRIHGGSSERRIEVIVPGSGTDLEEGVSYHYSYLKRREVNPGNSERKPLRRIPGEPADSYRSDTRTPGVTLQTFWKKNLLQGEGRAVFGQRTEDVLPLGAMRHFDYVTVLVYKITGSDGREYFAAKTSEREFFPRQK